MRSDDEQSKQIEQIDAAEYQKWLNGHTIIKACSNDIYALSKGRHNVTHDVFSTCARDHSKNPNQPDDQQDPDRNLVWDCTKSFDDIFDALNEKNIECYNGWLGVTMNSSDLVEFEREDVFDSFGSMFPETLFRGISNDLRERGATDVQICFTYFKAPVKRGASQYKIDKVAFRVSYKVASTAFADYYDMSDDPL